MVRLVFKESAMPNASSSPIVTALEWRYATKLFDSSRKISPTEWATLLDAFFEMVASDVLHGEKSARVAEWAARQAYLALGVLVTAAAAARIDSCPMEGLDAARYEDILGTATDGYQVIAACALGYRHAD